MLPALPLVLFVLTYLGLALGRIPGLKLDRTGFALLGAVGFLASGAISVEEAKGAVDAPTLVVLFGMMLLSAQYRLSGLYGAIGLRLSRTRSARGLLLGTIVVSGLLSAVLTNDVVCFALTPLLAGALLRAGRNPLPYLLALASTFAGNALLVGSIANLIVAEQAERLGIPFRFRDHLRIGLPITLVSLALAVAAMAFW